MNRLGAPTLPARRSLALTVLLLAGLFSLVAAAAAQGAVTWHLESVSKTAVAPGGEVTYYLNFANIGMSPTDGSEVKLTVALPAGMSGVSLSNESPLDCSDPTDATVITCEGAPILEQGQSSRPVAMLRLKAKVDPATPEGPLATSFDLEGGGAPVGEHTVDPIAVTGAEPLFGIDAFDSRLTTAGAPYTQAAGHPELLTTDFDLTSRSDPNPIVGDAWPLEELRDATVSLPPGLVGNPSAFSECTAAQLINGEFLPHPLCPPESQLGTVIVRHSEGTIFPIPVYNMVPPPGVPARFAFNVNGTVAVLDAHVRSTGDYGIDVTARTVPQAIAIDGNSISLWGVPGAPVHEPERLCQGSGYFYEGHTTCPVSRPPTAFLRSPTSCAQAVQIATTLRVDSWQHPGAFVEDSVSAHEAPGYPYLRQDWGTMVGTAGCGQAPFEPTVKASLTTNKADSPAGLSIDIGLPTSCWEAKPTAAEVEADLCESDIERTQVALPEGMSINPAAAGGREGCTAAQIGLTTPVASAPIHFDEAPVGCPDASKIGSVEIETPLLGRHDAAGKPVTDEAGNPVLEPLTGSVYLAQQSQNPFGSLLAIYLVAEGSGVIVKQAGEISLSPSGQVTTTFDQVPQTPVSDIHLELFGGQRAALRTPSSCGTYTAQATLVPWSGTGAVTRRSSFQVTQGCGGGFDPRLSAGTENPLAGTYSPFNLSLSREDGTQELGGLSVSLAPGLIGKPAGISYCPEATLAAISGETGTGAAQEHDPGCPAASQVGTVTVGAGTGTDPFYTQSGRAYLAGPYKGAPLSLAVVAPAVAGPFDLGSVVVRNALRVDPETTQITAVSDPLPTILHGIPLDLRDVRVDLNRPDFTLNPTDCEPLSIDATLTSAQGATAQRSNHFQAADCDRLGFKPRLALRLKGGTERTGHPALTAILRPRLGNANAAAIQVALPHAEFLAQSHIRTICTRVQFAAGGGGGEQCPKGSVYGKVSATSPLLDYPLTGKVYLRSSDNPLPDMVLALRGPASQPLEVDAVGRIDSTKNGGIRTTFAQVPDAPLTKVVLRLPGGRKSLLENHVDLCRRTHKATVAMTGQNGKSADFAARLRVKCPKLSKTKRHSVGKPRG